MNVLLLEDDQFMGSAISRLLGAQGIGVDWCQDGNLALDLLELGHDAFVLDVSVPGTGGLEVLEHVRRQYIDRPVLMISSHTDQESVIGAYDRGCTDYMRKPFYIRELIQKLQSLVGPQVPRIWLSREHYYDRISGLLYHRNQPLVLPVSDVRILQCLIRNLNRTVSIGELLEQAPGQSSGLSWLRTRIRNLRSILGESSIRTLRNQGYCLASVDHQQSIHPRTQAPRE